MAPPAELVKISEFARRSGVPAPTIKHYLREGLLPEPVRTSRNMARYDVAWIPRVRAIKELQRTCFLPLRVIRQVLDEGAGAAELAMESSIRRVLERLQSAESRTRAELLEAGVDGRALDELVELEVLTPSREADDERYAGDDLAMLRLLRHARRAGLANEMLPREILRTYRAAIANLVEVELELFRAGVLPAAGDDVAALTEVATSLSEELVVLLRRKLLLPTLQRLVEDEGDPPEETES
ncbi:MAG: MerR family transcriptional regulator [Proteobacteria bacterium]|nr:MerR family transcriptional regulator [Pseudomonadota bacterium]